MKNNGGFLMRGRVPATYENFYMRKRNMALSTISLNGVTIA